MRTTTCPARTMGHERRPAPEPRLRRTLLVLTVPRSHHRGRRAQPGEVPAHQGRPGSIAGRVMTARDRTAERQVADFYHSTVRTPERTAAERLERGPSRPRIRRFFAGMLTGMAIGSVVRRL